MVITGASSGVGSALAVHFSSHEYIVCGIARSSDKLDTLKQRIHNDLFTYQCDLRSLEEVKLTFERIYRDHDHIDVLVNNAGVFELKPFSEQEIETIDRIVDTNLKGAMYCTHLAIPSMIEREDGRLLPKINFPTLSKLSRICGADMMLSPSIWSIHPTSSPEECYRNAQILRAPLYHIKRTFPQPVGGIYPGTVEVLVSEYGYDFILPAGGGILGHPMGYRAGAIAMRQAIDAVMAGIPLKDAAKDQKNKELLAGLQKWGLRKRKITHWGYLGKDFNPNTADKNI